MWLVQDAKQGLTLPLFAVSCLGERSNWSVAVNGSLLRAAQHVRPMRLCSATLALRRLLCRESVLPFMLLRLLRTGTCKRGRSWWL